MILTRRALLRSSLAALAAPALIRPARAWLVQGNCVPAPLPQTFQLGYARYSSGYSVGVTITGSGIPAGSLIVVGAYAQSSGSSDIWSGTMTVTDTPNNTYTPLLTNAGDPAFVNEHVRGGLFYAYNSLALTSGDSIVLTSSIPINEGAAIGGLYATNVLTSGDPHDGGVDSVVVSSGSSSPSVTAAAPPVVSNSLMIGYGLTSTNGSTSLAPSGSPWITWLTGDDTGFTFAAGFVASYIVTSAQLSWQMSIGGSTYNMVGITAFKPGGGGGGGGGGGSGCVGGGLLQEGGGGNILDQSGGPLLCNGRC